MTWLFSLLVITFLIFFHELGHFLAARYFNVKVDIFSIGFGRSIFSINSNNTEYRISIIPLGGYVKMKGQDDTNPKHKSLDVDSYNSKAPWQRLIILLAGPFANFFLAFILYFLIAFNGFYTPSNIVGKVLDNSPAQIAGILKGDEIVSINSKNISKWLDISEYIKDSKLENIEVLIKRKNEFKKFYIKPFMKSTKNIYKETVFVPMIGIFMSDNFIKVKKGFLSSLNFGYEQTIKASFLIIEGLKKLITGIIPANELGGIVSIMKITSEASKGEMQTFLALIALISVNLGVLNLLPIPALDGGHIIFTLYELFSSKVPDENLIMKLTFFGWVILITLMIFGLYNDINRIID